MNVIQLLACLMSESKIPRIQKSLGLSLRPKATSLQLHGAQKLFPIDGNWNLLNELAFVSSAEAPKSHSRLLSHPPSFHHHLLRLIATVCMLLLHYD